MERLAHRYAQHRVQLPSLHPVLPLAHGDAVYGFAVPAAQAVDWWQRLRPLAAATGYWPLVMEPETPSFIEQVDRGVAEEYLAAAANLDGRALLGADAGPSWPREFRREVRRALAGRGKWPQEPVRHTFADLPTVSFGWYKTMLVAFFPVGASWQIPCLTGYGNWNGYPGPAEHAAILRYWEERHGAQLLAMSGDTIEIAVARPPSSRPDAVRLAVELVGYAPDGLSDYYGSRLVDVAAGLLDAEVWLAWWD